jgi:hypothetical protein
MRILHGRFGTKKDNEIAALAGSGDRACRYWRAGRGLSSTSLVNLLRSDAGPEVLDVILGEPRPEWYARQQKLLRIVELEQRAHATRAELKTLQRSVAP